MPVTETSTAGKDEQDGSKKNDAAYWRQWYVGVMVFLVAQIVLYYLITEHFK